MLYSDMQDVLRPFVMAIESKSSKLICLALVSVQKLVAADAIALDSLLVVIQDMEQVCVFMTFVGLISSSQHCVCVH